MSPPARQCSGAQTAETQTVVQFPQDPHGDRKQYTKFASLANAEVTVLTGLLLPAALVFVARSIGNQHRLGPSLAISDPIEDFVLGVPTDFSVKVQNPSGSGVLQVRNVHLSCGCTTLVRAPQEVQDGQYELIWLCGTPIEGDHATFSVDISVDRVRGEPLKLAIAGKVLPPLAGWPREARAIYRDGHLVVAISEQYKERLKRVACV